MGYFLKINRKKLIHSEKFGNFRIKPRRYGKNSDYVGTQTHNQDKMFHRLLFEDFYGKIPEGFHIHHKDENSLNNCILNLQIISPAEHNKLHFKGNQTWLGYKHTEESKKKMSEAKKEMYNGKKNPRYRFDVPEGEELYKEWEKCKNYARLSRKYNCSSACVTKRIKDYLAEEVN